MDFWDSFAKITAAEWLTIVGTFVAAIATTAAVWVAVASASDARKHAKADRELAAAETVRADVAEGKLIQAQLDAADRIAGAQREIERDRTSYTLRADAEKKATEQAILIWVKPAWESFDGHVRISGDKHATVSATVVNESSARIADVRVAFERAWGLSPLYLHADELKPAPKIVDEIRAKTSAMFTFSPVYVHGHTFGDELGFIVDFTDTKGDRWRLMPDRSLTLLNPRVVRVAETDAAPPTEPGA